MWLGIFDGSALVRCTEPVEWLHVTGRLKVPGCWWPRSYCNWSPAVNALGVLLLFQPFSPLFLSLFLSLSLCLNFFFYFFFAQSVQTVAMFDLWRSLQFLGLFSPVGVIRCVRTGRRSWSTGGGRATRLARLARLVRLIPIWKWLDVIHDGLVVIEILHDGFPSQSGAIKPDEIFKWFRVGPAFFLGRCLLPCSISVGAIWSISFHLVDFISVSICLSTLFHSFMPAPWLPRQRRVHDG